MNYSPEKLIMVNLASGALVGTFLYLAKRLGVDRRLEIGLGAIGLVGWVYMQWWYWTRTDFDPANHYPLHVCDFTSGLAVLSMLWPARWLRTLIYFLAPSAILAFLTPTGTADLGDLAFWLFWGGHIAIIGMFAYEVLIRGFRPKRRDYLFAVGFATVYFVAMFLLDWRQGWNYAYVGEEGPPFPLGGWPWHAPVMFALANIFFYILWLLGRDRSNAVRALDHDQTAS